MKPALHPWIALCAALAGCAAVGPDYKRPAIELPADYPAPLAALQAGAEVPGDWWNLYSDATLEELVAATRANNSDLRLAIAQVEEAEALVREARAAFIPEITGSAAGARRSISMRTTPPPAPDSPRTRSDGQLLASTTFEVDFWGRLRRADEAARAGLLGTSYAREVVEQTLVTAFAQSYFALRSLDAQIAVLAETIQARRDSLDIARARLDSGFAPELDVYQAQGALADALVQSREASRQRSAVERQLGQLTGRFDLRLAPGDVFALPVPPTPPAGLPSALLERRPDVRAAEQQLVAANALVGATKATLFPTVTLTGALGSQSAELSDLVSSGSGVWTLGLAAVMPLFDAGRRDAQVEQAEARARQAAAQYAGSVETAFREVADALTNLELATAAEADLAERVQAARNGLELSRLRYEAGYSPYLEVLDAQRTANEAEIAFVRNRQARLAFSADLMKALGGGWTA